VVTILPSSLATTLAVGEVSGSDVYFAGGGGGTPHRLGTNVASGDGGLGGGGTGSPDNVSSFATPGTANTGGGGGASRSDNATRGIGGQGGSGVVVVRYAGNQMATGGDDTRTEGGYTYHTFTSTGSSALSFSTLTAPLYSTISGNMSGTGGFTWGTAGQLALTGNNTYTGDTVVEAGTLALTGTGTIAGSANIQIDTGATLDVSGTSTEYQIGNGQTLTGTGAIVGNLTLASGSTLSPGASPGEMTVAGDLSLDNADLAIDIWGDGGAGVADTGHDLITFSSGSLSLANAPTITVDLNGFDPALDNSYTIISGITDWTGDWGDVSVVNAPAEWGTKSFRIDQGSVMLTVIPEPNTLGLLLVIGCAAILRRLRMR